MYKSPDSKFEKDVCVAINCFIKPGFLKGSRLTLKYYNFTYNKSVIGGVFFSKTTPKLASLVSCPYALLIRQPWLYLMYVHNAVLAF